MQISAPLVSEPHPILQRIEIASSRSIPSFHLIGLAGPEVAEARERIRAAIEASDFEFPRRRVVINLSPASVRKRGTGIDLAMALAVLLSDLGPSPNFREIVAWGELGLDGQVKPAGKLMRGIWAAWEAGAQALVLAAEEEEAARASVDMLKQTGHFSSAPPLLIGVDTLSEAWHYLKTGQLKPRKTHSIQRPDFPYAHRSKPETLPELRLAPQLERLVSIAASGRHHLFLLGPRGAGKSHALEWLLALQPIPTPELLVQKQLIAELSGSCRLTENRRVGAQCRPAALLGGTTASSIRPGEFSLAHGGVLIADELPEWPRDSRESLREPLEHHRVTITRAGGSLELPARFVLAANGNLCPCGGWPVGLGTRSAHSQRALAVPVCHCGFIERQRYWNRLSGPLLDRLDLCAIVNAEMPPAPGNDPKEVKKILESLRERAALARSCAVKNWGKVGGDLPAEDLERLIAENPSWREHLDSNCTSLRSRHKILRVALSLCAWDGKASPRTSDFLEARIYRPEEIRKDLCETEYIRK